MEQTVVLKAYKGDRAANLDGIAEAMEFAIPAGEPGDETITMPRKTAHRIGGYADQLRVIARELREERQRYEQLVALAQLLLEIARCAADQRGMGQESPRFDDDLENGQTVAQALDAIFAGDLDVLQAALTELRA